MPHRNGKKENYNQIKQSKMTEFDRVERLFKEFNEYEKERLCSNSGGYTCEVVPDNDLK